MKTFQPMMIPLAYVINVPGSAGGAIRQTNAEQGIYHAIGTELYFIYDPIFDTFSYFDLNTQMPGEELTQEEVLQYTMELYSTIDI